ncbi:hypothetical protein BKA70DRAFT_1222871 [Coprinopsis sp. MPI-PUGE-AT-0042]|nr:hypothetical protein BKA70DRAFT_1222871 [Coprinopsis sp. MPI-PUGE-AT-0042]
MSGGATRVTLVPTLTILVPRQCQIDPISLSSALPPALTINSPSSNIWAFATVGRSFALQFNNSIAALPSVAAVHATTAYNHHDFPSLSPNSWPPHRHSQSPPIPAIIFYSPLAITCSSAWLPISANRYTLPACPSIVVHPSLTVIHVACSMATYVTLSLAGITFSLALTFSNSIVCLRWRNVVHVACPNDWPPALWLFPDVARTVQDGFTPAIRALLQLNGVDVALEDREGRSSLMVACDAFLNGTMTSRDFSGFLQHSPFNINAKNSHGTTALAYAVARGVIATAEEILSLSPEGLNELSPELDSPWRRGPLYEVQQLDFRMHLKEHPNDQPSETSIDVIVTGRQLPHFLQFRLPYRGTLRKDHRRALEKCGSLRLPARISKERVHGVQLLLKHSDIREFSQSHREPPMGNW